MKRLSILVVSVLVALTILVIAAIWTQVTSQYQARAEVRVRSVIPRLVFQTEDNGRIPRYRSFVNTQVSVMRSLQVLQRVLDQPEVQKTQWYKNQKPRKHRISLVQRLLGITPYPPPEMRGDFRGEKLGDNLSVRPRRRTGTINVSFLAGSAEDAKLILNTVLEQYIRYTGEMSDATHDKLYRQLVDQYKALENEILGRERVTAELRRQLGTTTPQELISSRRIHLDKTQVRLSELRQDIAVLEWEMKKGDPADSNKAPVDDAGTREHQLARAKYAEQLLLTELKKQQAELDELFHSAQLLEKENTELLHKRQLFDAVRQRVDQKNMERNVPGPIEILTRAAAPSEPYKDHRPLFTAIAIVLCLGMSSSMVLLLRRRKSETDKGQQT